MNNETSRESASLERERERLESYSLFARLFSYPDEAFFESFPHLADERQAIQGEYDTLFRARGVWLYTTEYTAKGDFQKAHGLSDVMGFYRAFGLQIRSDRPDALAAELDFMHTLIFKRLYAVERRMEGCDEKAAVCREAEVKFFAEHLYPGAQAIAERIASEEGSSFYRDAAAELMDFLSAEQGRLRSQGPSIAMQPSASTTEVSP